MLFLHPGTLSPDPLSELPSRALPGNWSAFDLFPNELIRAYPQQRRASAWSETLDAGRRPGELVLQADPGGRAEIVLDFGTEVEGRLQIDCMVPAPSNIYVTFGESIPEAEAWGGLTLTPHMTEHRHFERRGKHTALFQNRGFRFIRILAHDMSPAFTMTAVAVHAETAFQKRYGEFNCTDTRFQRVWQTSAYTARLCTRRDGYWDGIKRDRVGWYGDARITQETTDAVFFDPAPAEAMLVNLQADAWANEIPGYSFDAIAMLRQVILLYGGDRPAVREAWNRVRALLRWVEATQVDSRGLLTRNSRTRYQFGIGFVDWSVMPVGGRLEELCWLQCKYLEGLRNAAQIALWLGKRQDHLTLLGRADALARRITALFWKPGKGFLHTLNMSQRQWDKFTPDNHYPQTYEQKRRLGPSGPSRHSGALAVWAGLCTTPAMARAVLASLDRNNLVPVITGYFAYYEQSARAQCGDAAGAIMNMRDYIGTQIEKHDSAAVWESYEPEVADFRKWGLHTWQKSLCHGWSSGSVGIAQKYLLGVTPESPGFAEVSLSPAALELPWAFEAVVPTPLGPIEITRPTGAQTVTYRLPRKMKVIDGMMDRIRIL